MSHIKKLKVSLTKNGYFKVWEVIEKHPSVDILANINGTYPGINLEEAQIIGMLSIDPTTKSVPSVWDDVRLLGTDRIQYLTFISILFSHYNLIEIFRSGKTSEMKGSIHRLDPLLGGKGHTNLVDTMNTIGLSKTKKGSDKAFYDFEILFQSDLGPLVKDILLLKLEKIGWKAPKDDEFCRDFYTQCFYYGFHEALAISKSQFKDWLEGRGIVKTNFEKHPLILDTIGDTEFEPKNILLKGVPGTGKSHLIDNLIKKIKPASQNIKRINIHSASSNADLMQGIAIGKTEDGGILYSEKQGLIFKHIQNACFSPKQAFVLILEEIQENSLNELIGDLVYLIEPEKRARIQDTKLTGEYTYSELIGQYIEERAKVKDKKPIKFVEIPNLVDGKTEYRKMIMPDNLYIFCTSNYRDDKKVIEDNLLRRFDVIEVYPDYGDFFNSKYVAKFLQVLNNAIVNAFSETEIHPDRFLIGHANWYNIKDKEKEKFYKALLKVFIEFKEIKEIDFNLELSQILNELANTKNNSWVFESFNNIKQEIETNAKKENIGYKQWVESLQCKIYTGFIDCSKPVSTNVGNGNS